MLFTQIPHSYKIKLMLDFAKTQQASDKTLNI